MLCSITELRRLGVRLARADLAPPEAGELLVADHETRSFRRRVRAATFRRTTPGFNQPTDIYIPIFDPVLTVISAEEMVLTGVQLASVEGAPTRMVEYVQVWWVREVGHRRISD